MDGFVKLTSVIDDALRQTAEDSAMLLGQQLTIDGADPIATNRQTYFCDMDDVCFVADVAATGDYAGTFHLVFGLRDAITMSGFLLGIPPARINEKRRLAIMENDDTDAFSEIINQTVGSFNSIFQPAFANRVHLKVTPPRKFIPESTEMTDSEPVPDGEYILFRARMEMPGMEMGNLDILMPRQLAELFDPPSEEDARESEEEGGASPGSGEEGDGSAAPIDSTGDGSPATGSDVGGDEGEKGGRRVLVLEDDESDRRLVCELLEARGYEAVEAGLDSDIREIMSQGGVRLVVLGIHNNDDRDMSLCIKLKAIAKGESLPIIMCAREWTRSSVLKAVKYGARDIIVKPYQPDEVVAKVEKFLKAA